MRLTRLYVAATIAQGSVLELPAEPATHVARVLRGRSGDPLVLFNGDGREFAAVIDQVRGTRVSVTVGAPSIPQCEAPWPITLLQSVPRGERMDWIVQKATELGVARIVPLVSRRCVVRLDPEQGEAKAAHWHAVAVAACEQSGRTRLPTIERPRRLDEFLGEPADGRLRLLLDPLATGEPRGERVFESIEVAVGPEGGFEAEEIDWFRLAGFAGLRLGPRILRTETAAVAAMVWLQSSYGDLRAGLG
ncbi:MAG: 16S rRNA (uracil(1498)-N(3))-methyltransferase [Gammaproteobacteria bacterium]|nr:16S rRNA (uracil(1498)-N(3))-methyltransferase [Gammaproteobacteria bacterium]